MTVRELIQKLLYFDLNDEVTMDDTANNGKIIDVIPSQHVCFPGVQLKGTLNYNE